MREWTRNMLGREALALLALAALAAAAAVPALAGAGDPSDRFDQAIRRNSHDMLQEGRKQG